MFEATTGNWNMSVIAGSGTDGDVASDARRLQLLLQSVSTCVATEYGQPLTWADPEPPFEEWCDLGTVEAAIRRNPLRDEDGTPVPGGGFSGSVQAFRTGLPIPMINMRWDIAGRERGFDIGVVFYPGDCASGEAKSLPHHPIEWLVHLVSTAGASVEASQVRIETSRLGMKIFNARPECIAGAVTLAPHGIGVVQLPDSISVHPCPIGYPNGQVIVTDLASAVEAPQDAVDNVLIVDDLLHDHSGGDHD